MDSKSISHSDSGGVTGDPVRWALREADHIVACYRRHVAVRPRATRDVRMGDELCERLAAVHARLASCPGSGADERVGERMSALDRERALLAGERRRILAARGAGSREQRARWLAARLDHQIELYRLHAGGHTRLSCRPGLIRRIIAGVQDIRTEADSVGRDAVDGDRIHTVLAELSRELEMVELVHQGASTAERVAGLGAAANLAIRDYDLYFAGQDRVTRDVGLLGHICDRMAEIEQQMLAVAQRYRSHALAHSLEVVQVCLDLYQQEHARIQAAQNAEHEAG